MFFNVALAALLGTNKMSLSWSGASAALDARIFLRSTGISSCPCAVVRRIFVEPFLAV